MIRAKELRTKICSQELKSADVVKECFARIKEVEPKVKAFLKLNEAGALQQAEKVDKHDNKRCGFLEGVPIAIKDNIMVKGESMTSSSKYLKNYVSPYDATVIEKLKEAGAVFVGRTN